MIAQRPAPRQNESPTNTRRKLPKTRRKLPGAGSGPGARHPTPKPEPAPDTPRATEENATALKHPQSLRHPAQRDDPARVQLEELEHT